MYPQPYGNLACNWYISISICDPPVGRSLTPVVWVHHQDAICPGIINRIRRSERGSRRFKLTEGRREPNRSTGIGFAIQSRRMSSPARSSASTTTAGCPGGGVSGNAGFGDDASSYHISTDLMSAHDRKEEALVGNHPIRSLPALIPHPSSSFFP